MPRWEIVLFVVAALVAGGLTMGGVTLAYFLDQWRETPPPGQGASPADERRASPFGRAA